MTADYSPLIARLSVHIELLRDWDPDGQWQHNPLLLAYLRNPYSLKLSQASDLDLYLSLQVQECEVNQRYKQLEISDIV
jgi:hypothetical protein